METTSLFWLVLSITLFVLLGSIGLAIWAIRHVAKNSQDLAPVLLRQLELVDKATSLAAASDIWAYQGIRAMDQSRAVYDEEPYDPSPEAEARREAQRMNIDPEDLSAEDNAELAGYLS